GLPFILCTVMITLLALHFTLFLHLSLTSDKIINLSYPDVRETGGGSVIQPLPEDQVAEATMKHKLAIWYSRQLPKDHPLLK
ncbi:MAG TPA: DUF5062 family protein, partial [Steroidobacteraceae bacterium]|nr:DUF5062 family protein [Steroidobacteraceae bacterium]